MQENNPLKDLSGLELINKYQDILTAGGYLKSLSNIEANQKQDWFLFNEEVNSRTSYLDSSLNNRQRMKYIKFDITLDNIECPVEGCSNNIVWNSSKSIFKKVCNIKDPDHIKCTNDFRYMKSKESIQEKYNVDNVFELNGIQKKAKETIKEKYGVEYISQSPDIQEKIKETNLKKYGGHYSTTSEYIRRVKETNLKKYGAENYKQSEQCKIDSLKKHGVESYSMTPEYKRKVKETNLLRYGGCYSKIDEAKQRAKEFNLKKYGVEHYYMSDDFKNKAKETNLKKYGVDHYSKSPEFKQQVKETNLKKYGVEFYSNTEEYKQRVKETNLKKYGGHYSSTEECKQRVKETNLKKYGVDHYSKSSEYKQQVKITNLKKYGGHYSRTPEYKQRVKETNLKKYGTEFYTQSKHFRESSNTLRYRIQEAAKSFTLKKESPMSSSQKDLKGSEVLQKYSFYITSRGLLKGENHLNKDQKDTKKELIDIITSWTSFLSPDLPINKRIKFLRFNMTEELYQCPVPGCSGVRYWCKNDSIFRVTCSLRDTEHTDLIKLARVNSIKETVQEKYGVSNVAKLDHVQTKMKETNLKRYKKENYAQTEEYKIKTTLTNLRKYGGHHMTTEEGKEKVKITNLRKHGVEFYQQSEHRKITSLKKYGVEHYFMTEECKQKIKETSLKKYGGHYLSSDHRKITSLKKYGTEFYLQSDQYKIESLRKYGVEFYSSTEECKNKVKKTNLRKYGGHYSSTEECKNKVKKTNLRKHGVEFYSSTEECKNKVKKTNLRKHGINIPIEDFNPDLSRIDYQILDLSSSSDTTETNFLESYLRDNKSLDVKKFMKDFDCSITTAYKVFREYGIEYKSSNQSKAEYEIIDYIKSLIPDIKIIHGSRQIIKPKELDIYLPDFKLAIEYNGLMYHSQGSSEHGMFDTPNQNPNRHQEKTNQCEDKGIHLLHINEDEWILRPHAWKLIISKALKIDSVNKDLVNKDSGVENDIIKNISSVEFDNQVEAFLSMHPDTSIDLTSAGEIRFGIFRHNRLIELMTFKEDKTLPSENIFTIVVLISLSLQSKAGLLLEAFENQYNSNYRNQAIIFATADRNRFNSDRNIYDDMGFDLWSTNKPTSKVFNIKDPFIFHPDGNKYFGLQELAQDQRRIFSSGSYSYTKNIRYGSIDREYREKGQ